MSQSAPSPHSPADLPAEPTDSPAELTSLPAELIDSILSYLSPHALTAVSATCTLLRKHAISDKHWRTFVQENIPGPRLTTSYPFDSYRELYATHDTKWFLTKHKIWFCGHDLVGKLLLARYDQRRGCIEAYQLVAISNHLTDLHNWLADENDPLQPFDPRVALHVDKPVIKFAANIDPESHRAPELYGLQGHGFAPEVPMVVDENPNSMRCNFLLAKPMPPKDIGPKVLERFPYGSLWPPPAIPAPHRVVGSPGANDEYPHLRPDELPTCRSEASDHIFRIRQWIEVAPNSPANLILNHDRMMRRAATGEGSPPSDDGTTGSPAGNPGRMGAHFGQQIITYSTLDPELYTPTPLKPWRGIWVGDYGGHGCEFLLIHQPDDPRPVSDEQLGLVRGEDETDEEWDARWLERRVYRGMLVAIKLTGDPNVPRGEQTFVAENLSDEEYGRESEDSPFFGARVVPSKGHIARTGFQDGGFMNEHWALAGPDADVFGTDEYVDSRLLLISHDRLAQRWIGNEHISFFERVDIDRFLDPNRRSGE